MSLSQLQQESKFKRHLTEFWASKGITQYKIPQIGGQELNLYKLYKSVCRRGGGQLVSHNKLWKEIVDEFGLPSTCTSASFTLKNHYQRYLLAYEQKYQFGKDDNAELPQLVAGRMRKTMNIRGEELSGAGNRVNVGIRNDLEIQQHSTLQADLNKHYEWVDKNQTIHYIKRSKMYPATSEIKHMMMAFESGIEEEIVYAINILTMYSVNSEAPLLLHQYPNVLDSINSFLDKRYPPKDLFDLECLRNLTLALRNLSANIKNLSPMVDSPLMKNLTRIFDHKTDKQLLRNIVGILSSMTKVGWDCKDLTVMIEEYLEKDGQEDLETGIQLMRALVEDRQELCEDIITSKLDLFCRLLMNSALQIREAVLEIFAYIIQKSEKVRSFILNSHKVMSRLFGMMSYSGGRYQKQAQLVGFILGSINHTEQNLRVLKGFEKDLMLISFNDDSLSSITAGILFSLTHPQGQGKESQDKEGMDKSEAKKEKNQESVRSNHKNEEQLFDDSGFEDKNGRSHRQDQVKDQNEFEGSQY